MQQFSQICTEDGENDRGGKDPSIICPGRNTAEKSSSTKTRARDTTCSILLKTQHFKELHESKFSYC